MRLKESFLDECAVVNVVMVSICCLLNASPVAIAPLHRCAFWLTDSCCALVGQDKPHEQVTMARLELGYRILTCVRASYKGRNITSGASENIMADGRLEKPEKIYTEQVDALLPQVDSVVEV